jgi:hypothetical protein
MTVRARVLFAGLVAMSAVVIARPASAKADIAEANITGPGLGGGMRIEAPDTEGLWESGVDVVGGLDDTRADSVKGLGLSPADLGPEYLVTYRFFGDDLIRQELYPYAKGGPVTYLPAGQELKGVFGHTGNPLPITTGWYQGSLGFFQYLVDHGLPETSPVALLATDGVGPGTAPRAQRPPWAAIWVVLLALAALSLTTLAVHRRVLTAGRVNR